jgi:hypothetical protein
MQLTPFRYFDTIKAPYNQTHLAFTASVKSSYKSYMGFSKDSRDLSDRSLKNAGIIS